jgi:HlyD family secretion protein
MRSSRSRVWLWTLVFFSVAGSLLFVILRPKTVDVETVRVVRSRFTDVIRSEGFLRSRRRISVSAFADGDMMRMDYKIGDQVRKGQVLTGILWDREYEPLRSPMKGVVSRVFRDSAGPVRRGEVILELVDPDDLEAVVELLTPDAGRVRPGMPVQIESLSLDRHFRGEVQEVSRAGFVKVSALGVEEERTEVRIRLLDRIPLQLGGNEFHLDAVIEVSTTPGALLIPIGSVFRDGDQWAVYRFEAGIARKARFQAGARSEGRQVVLSGLEEGAEILNFPGDRIRDGVRIRRIRIEQGDGSP